MFLKFESNTISDRLDEMALPFRGLLLSNVEKNFGIRLSMNLRIVGGFQPRYPCYTRSDKVSRKLVSLVFNPSRNKPLFLCVCSTSLLKTLWEKEKLLVTSNFFFSQCFLSVWRTICHFH